MSDQINHILQKGNPFSSDQQYLHVETLAQLKEQRLFDADAMVIESNDEKTVLAMIRQIRGMRFKNFYLKPIFLSSNQLPEEIIRQADGVMEIAKIQQLMGLSAAIGRRIKEVRTINTRYSFKEAALVKTLQYLYTRDCEMIPFRSRSATIGYVFPYLSNLIPQDENNVLLDVLKMAEDENWIEAKVVDRVNLCKTCLGSYLNFRESCTNCLSIDLKTIELIHHFRCAYIGPASDFEKSGKLICPKCDKELRHIGIDYDKPSEINECNTCGHQSQEATMKALCVDCGTENELQYLQTRAINHYHMTSFGRDLATTGIRKFDNQAVPEGEDRRIVTFQIWAIMCRHEQERSLLRKTKSKVGILQLREEVLTHLDQTTREKIMKETLLAISHYIRPVDIVTARDLNTFLIMLPEQKEKDVKYLKEVLDYNVQKLLGDNLGIDQLISKLEFYPLQSNLDIEQL